MSARWALTALLAAAIVSPLVRDRAWDSFPISSYPMFARGDLGRRVSLGHGVLVDRSSRDRTVVAGVAGRPIVRSRLHDTVAAGGPTRAHAPAMDNMRASPRDAHRVLAAPEPRTNAASVGPIFSGTLGSISRPLIASTGSADSSST